MRATLIVGTLLAPLSCAAAQDAPKRDCGALSEKIEGIAWALDGDTLAMLAGGQRTPDIRLWGIQAPELRDRRSGIENPAGMHALAALKGKIDGEPIVCRAIEWDRYCRAVATCDHRGDDIGKFMLTIGMSYLFTRYALRPDMI